MKAVNHYLIIEPIKEALKKVGGLILTDETNEDNRYLKAKVISIGNLVEGIKEDDIICLRGMLFLPFLSLPFPYKIFPF